MERRPRVAVISTSRADDGLLQPVRDALGHKYWFDGLRQTDIVVLLGDRYDTLLLAMDYVRSNIPIAHIHGGDKSGREHMDDKLRDAITMLADLHFPATWKSYYRLLNMGVAPETTWMTGSPALDDIVGKKHVGGDYIVVLQHPVSSQARQFKEQCESTWNAVKSCGRDVVWIRPNNDPGHDGVNESWWSAKNSPITLQTHKNLPRPDFIDLLCNCHCLVGNSSAAYVECSYLGVPCVDVGDRQNGRENAGNVLKVPHRAEVIELAIEGFDGPLGHPESSNLYGDGHASERIVEHILEWWDDKTGGQPGRHHA